MSSDPSSPAPSADPNLSGLGRALMDTGGSKPSTGPWVPPTAEELHAILSQYEIVKMLGRGGMGAVYMGRQTSLDRPVAIKILSSKLEDSDQGFTERFKNEAKAMAKLNHPGIVSVYDFGSTAGGLLYIVMEYVDGTDVAKMIAKSGRLHTEHAMAITAHVCDSLAYAHERGIIHRDIKPANIMVGYDGEVKVADFGLAKVNVGGHTMGLTMSGMAMGTLHFMAPEALMLGTAVDHRADIYAVGVMLYQMLTGKLPQGMFKMPSLLVSGLDPRYDGIIAKAIMEDREARYQSAREMRADLDSILTQPVFKVETPAAAASGPPAVLPTQARPQRPGARAPQTPRSMPQPLPVPQRSLTWLWVLISLLVLAAGGAWIFLPREKPAAEPLAAAAAASAAPASETTQPAVPTLSPAPPQAPKVSPALAPPPAVSETSPSTTTLTQTFGGHRYQFVPGSFSWQEAKAKAESLGGHLATITSKEENDFLLRAYGSQIPAINRNIWLGAIEENSSTGWKWVTGEPFAYTGWVENEPNGAKGGGGEVGYPFMLNLYNFRGGVTGWNDSSTHESQTLNSVGFIVEWDGTPPTATAETKPTMPQSAGTSAVSSPSTATAASGTDDTSGWQSLFNGKDLSGWELRPSNLPADVYGGLMRIRGSSTVPTSGNLYYRGAGATLPQWTDFELICTAMTENKGNSGIFIHASPGASEPNRANGIEVQILNDPQLNASSRTLGVQSGGLQRIANAGILYRDGEWFQIKVRVEGRRVQTWLKKPNDTLWLPGVDWTQPANWAAFSDRPGIKLGSGTISLQNNPPLDGTVWIKELKFRSLDKSGTPTPPPATAAAATPVASDTTWIDTKGRVIKARFVLLSGDNLVLAVAGKNYPLSLATLSTESQAMAQKLQAASPANPKTLEEALINFKWEWTHAPRPPDMLQFQADGMAVCPRFQWNWKITGPRTVHAFNASEGGRVIQNWQADLTFDESFSKLSATSANGAYQYTGRRMELISPASPAKPKSVVSQQIPSNAQSFGSSRYAYFDGTYTWKAAKAKAEALGGHLATITTAAEDAWVIANFQSKVMPSRKQFWIGASQETPGQPWQWVTGEPFEFTQWAPGEPNNAKGTDAKSKPPYMLGYLFQANRMGWNDFSESQLNWKEIIVGYLVEWDNAVKTGVAIPAPAEAGFISLLDATQPGDWVQVGPGEMTIRDGVATTSSPSKWGVAIYSKRTFGDFILKAEFKGMGPVFNSGVWLRIADLRNDILKAADSRYEVGIVHPGGDQGRFTGSIWGFQPARSESSKANDWNELEITVTGQRYVVKLNGIIVNDFTGSKGVTGYIGLEENAAGSVQLRNVRVKPLS